MSEFLPSCQNGTPGLFNRSWSGWHHYQVIGAAETIILPSLIGIICSTGLVGNILIAFTIIRTQKRTIPYIYNCNLIIADLVHIISMTFLILASGFLAALFAPLLPGRMQPVYMQCHYDCNEFGQVYTLSYYNNFIFPLPLIFICYILILCYTGEMYQQNKKAGSYTSSILRQRVMRLTKMVLALVSVFVVSTAPFHVIQLVNLQVSQLTPTFSMSYYISICLSYASSSINPFLYILLSGNFQKRLWRCTNLEVRMAERDVNIFENTLRFLKGGSSPNKNVLSMYRFYRLQ